MATTELGVHERALRHAPFALVITDPNTDDNPIVFVNYAFSRLTGYTQEACIGRNCRFLQGEGTDASTRDELRSHIVEGTDCTVEIVNYRADGSAFLNRLHISPLHGDDGRVEYFIGVQRAVGAIEDRGVLGDHADDALREINHRVKNHLSMIVGMIRMQARNSDAGSKDNFTTLARRIEALQFLYDEMTSGPTTSTGERSIPLGAYVSRIASAIAYLDGRSSIRLNLDLANPKTDIDLAAQVGLLVSELLTNAFQHAFQGRDEGLVDVRITELSDGTVRVQVADDGVGLPEGARWPDGGGLGGKIVRSLLTGLRADLNVTQNTRGTMLTVDLNPQLFAKPLEQANGQTPHAVAAPDHGTGHQGLPA